MPDSASEAGATATEEIHTSVILYKLIGEAPADHFTLGWLIGNLPKRSFGVILLFLGLISMLPVISVPACILMLILTFQIIVGYHNPVLPRRLMIRPLPSRCLLRLERHVIPLLRHLEVIVRPRWPILLKGTRRIAALAAMLLALLSLSTPLPLANTPPAMIFILMALAYIEHDGLVLTIAFVSALVLLTAAFVVIS